MPRFLHTADWQIGRHYPRFDKDDAAALAEARFKAIEILAELAAREHCAAVLVAGDIFDAQTVSERCLRRVFNALQAFTGPWILLPGNHDAALAESVWSRAQRLNIVPPHVHLALEPVPILLPEQGLAVLPAPLRQRHSHEDLTAWFDQQETPAGLLRIGLAHGCVQGLLAEDIDSANPIAADRATRARLDYLALGDWHGCKSIDARTWYSGTPEPERFPRNEPGHALVVDVAAPGAEPQVTPHATAQYHWLQWQANLRVPSDLDELLRRLEQLPAPVVLALEVAGEIDLAGQERLREALAAAQAKHRSLVCDTAGLRLCPTEADLAALSADGYLGEVVEILRAHQEAGDDAIAREALNILAGLLRERQAQTAEAEEVATCN